MQEFAASRRDIASLISRLRRLCVDVVERGFAGDHTGATTFISLNRGMLDTAEEYVFKTYDLTDRSAIRDSLKDSAEVADEVLKNLSEVFASDTSSIPYQVVFPLERWFRSFGVQTDLFFRAEHSALYELFPYTKNDFAIEEPAGTLQQAIDRTRWPVQRVTVPSLSLATFPHFAIVAHEVGHAVYESMKDRVDFIQQRTFNFDKFDGDINRLLQRSLSNQEQTSLSEIYAQWLEELCADFFAVELTGPAYFFSFCSFVEMVNGGFGVGEHHPPNFLRRQAMYEMMETPDGYSQAFRDITGEGLTLTINSPTMLTTEMYGLFYQLQPVYGDVLAAIMAALTFNLDEVIKKVRSAVRRFGRRANRNALYSPTRFREDLDRHLTSFIALIPPIERPLKGRRKGYKVIPEDFTTIINVGWVASLSSLEKLNLGLGRDFDFRENFERSNLLLLKAVELSEARRAWEKGI